ncbi:hypothetical protein [Nocardia bovistercoris]|uniref:Uncharacterized protein n=1 Tax=Nocardia bovistercoris TaxID=2785916 RepID=A0A931I9B0_9NOCA|nr:hypothetical protein [Nocardia bovistercoris]MBH0775713.1 hypothetical protein [Nocardia bovistercoris]
MIENAHRDETPLGVRRMTQRIRYRAHGYCDLITQPDQPGNTLTSGSLLAEFHHQVEKLVLDYENEEIPARGDALIFGDIYNEYKQPGEYTEPPSENGPTETDDRGDAVTKAITKLLALETEFRGPRELSVTQNHHLAKWYEKLGHTLRTVDLPSHAALAFKRATRLHGLAQDPSAQDRCRLKRARAKRRATTPAWKRIPGWVSDALCGYGFLPFRLLFCVVVQMALVTTIFLIVEDQSFGTSFQMCVTNYLAPVGLPYLDSKNIGVGGRVVLNIEAWMGIVTTSVFFALLVRRWFRI